MPPKRIQTLDKWAIWATHKWEAQSKLKHDSFRFRAYTYGNTLMDRIPADEWFVKDVITQASVNEPLEDELVVLHNSNDEDKVLKQFQEMLRQRKEYHKKAYSRSFLTIPLCLLFGLIPIIPNFPLFYNLFRLYSHNRARRGVAELLSRKIQMQRDLSIPQKDNLSKPYLHQLRRQFNLSSDTFVHYYQRASLKPRK